MLNVRIGYLLILGALFFANSSYAQQVTGVDGDSRTGESVTIYGNDFGTKTGNEPLLWDDLSQYQGLADYQQAPTGDNYPWPTGGLNGHKPYYYSNPDSIRVPGRPLYGATRAGNFFGGNDYELGENSIITCNYWLWFNEYPPILAAGHVTKLIRFWSQNAVPYTGVNLFFDSTQNGSVYRYYSDGFVPKETWLHFEVVIHNSSGMTTDPESTSAYYEVYLNGQKASDFQPLVGDHAAGGDVSYIHRFGFDVRGEGFYDDWPTGEIIRFGDIHIDQSVARVIIADTQDFQWNNDQAVHWEIQPISVWNSSSVTVNFNAGSFPDNADVYLYVIDENGAISNPWPLVIDQENQASPEGPGQAGQPVF